MAGAHKYGSKNSQRCRVQKLCLQVWLILWQSCPPIYHQPHTGGTAQFRVHGSAWGLHWGLHSAWGLHSLIRRPQPSRSAPPVAPALGCSRGMDGLTRSPLPAPECSHSRLLQNCSSQHHSAAPTAPANFLSSPHTNSMSGASASNHI